MSLKKRISSTGGKTFIELMIGLAIFSFMLLGFYALLNFTNTQSFVDTTRLDLQQQARGAMDRMVREIRESSSITIAVLGTDSDRITFTTPNETGIQYYRSGTNLVRNYPSGTIITIASNIALLDFTQSSSLLTVQIRADKTIYGQTLSALLTEKVRLRND